MTNAMFIALIIWLFVCCVAIFIGFARHWFFEDK